MANMMFKYVSLNFLFLVSVAKLSRKNSFVSYMAKKWRNMPQEKLIFCIVLKNLFYSMLTYSPVMCFGFDL